MSNLQARLSRMSRAFRPLFVTVTWGAGGTTSAKSLELAEICQRQLGLTTCLHLTCTNMSKKLVDDALEECKALGIRNILALRGDPPREDEYRLEPKGGRQGEQQSEKTDAVEFVWAVDLVRYIRKNHGDYFCIGVAGYPEGHSDESHPTDQDPRHDLPYLVEKVKPGADFIMTQLFYDEKAYLKYERMLRECDDGIFKDIVIIPGLMPIQSYQILKRTTKLSHAKLPAAILERLESVKGDDDEVKRVGVDVISEIVEEIKAIRSPGPRGFHFYTLNLEKVVGFILERCDLIPPSTPIMSTNDDFAVEDMHPSMWNGVDSLNLMNGEFDSRDIRRRLSSRRLSSPHNHVITDGPSNHHSASASTITDHEPSRATTLAISHGIGSLGREATWDDYPNGRFGDARSPAFGEIDGYGGPKIHVSPAAARQLWGSPTTKQDIGALFRHHVMGELHKLPWSEDGLNDETSLIREELKRLIEDKGYWSVASQPAVDGIRSSDPIFGWGPRNGFVFQKPFIEFFISASQWNSHLRPHLLDSSVAPEVSWYAGNAAGEFENSSCNRSDNPGLGHHVGKREQAQQVNAVTWGVFPGKEIVTPTIVEEVSFRAWCEEAFGIWAEWEAVHPRDGATKKLLRECRQDLWLVNVICHEYRQPERLWDILDVQRPAEGRYG